MLPVPPPATSDADANKGASGINWFVHGCTIAGVVIALVIVGILAAMEVIEFRFRTLSERGTGSWWFWLGAAVGAGVGLLVGKTLQGIFEIGAQTFTGTRPTKDDSKDPKP